LCFFVIEDPLLDNIGRIRAIDPVGPGE
jgi:hypothetical protein